MANSLVVNCEQPRLDFQIQIQALDFEVALGKCYSLSIHQLPHL